MPRFAETTIRLTLFTLALVCAFFCCFTKTGISAEAEGFRSVSGPCNLRFPEDHGPHSGYKTEWWYYTGNL
ncbi:MAG TPA: hypothetical protein VLT88_14450, partial [Desulfosarcina sp.]|nr:hypothetical protein [Desulfosarcina sp.]